VADEVVVEGAELLRAVAHARVGDGEPLELLELARMVLEPAVERVWGVSRGKPARPPVQDGDDLGGVLRASLRRHGRAREVVAEALEPGDERGPRDLVPTEQGHAAPAC
jgi:hypothetical protein